MKQTACNLVTEAAADSHIRLSPSQSYSLWLAAPWSHVDCHCRLRLRQDTQTSWAT